ncbi:hypothetical protein B0H13DRAFT_2367939 [Mycena leptocephala]|nr:hypothetical protein B0H13DRAFT_2367939 [Mycena leptocephala]
MHAAGVISNELATNTHSPETLTTTVRPPSTEHGVTVRDGHRKKKQESGSGAASPPPDVDAELGGPKRNVRLPAPPDFSVEGLADFDAGRATKQVDIDAHASFPILTDSKETSVNIEVPSGSSTVASRVFAVPRHGKLPRDDLRCKREKVIAALTFWPDLTHLANFDTAKLWPIYMLFGNLSKYIRVKPNAGAGHHVAYIPSLPDSIQDKISAFSR